MKSKISRPAGILITSLFAIAVIETAFRLVIFPDWKSVAWAPFIKHPIYGTFQKSNMVARRYNPPNFDVINRTNSQGFRDREEGFEDDLKGIWVAGGSNTFAAFVEDHETYASRLQARGYVNANLGSEGHTIPEQVLVMRHMLSLGHKPRAILLEMSLFNHLSDYESRLENLSKPLPQAIREVNASHLSTAKGTLLENTKTLYGRAGITWLSVKGRLVNNSAAYGWLKVGINEIPYLRQKSLEWGLRADADLVLGGNIDLLRELPGNPADRLIDSSVKYVTAVRDWIRRELNVPFGMIVVPSRFQTENEKFREFYRHHGYTPSELDIHRPYRLFLQKLRANGVPVFGALSVLETANGAVSFPDDGHMTAESHDRVAQGLASWLPRELGIGADR